MKRFGRLVILAMMTAALMVPGFGGTASAQDGTDLCALALDAGVGAKIQGYTVVEFTGGSGSQIVLGYGDATLSGGSGNDVLCAWGTGNTLDGGSGNDLLVAMDSPGNAFYGGSGNDTMIGYEDDYFDGGSGRNTENRIALPINGPDNVSLNGPDDNWAFFVSGTGMDSNIELHIDVIKVASGTAWSWHVITQSDGSFSSPNMEICYWTAEPRVMEVTITQGGSVIYSEQFDPDCTGYGG